MGRGESEFVADYQGEDGIAEVVAQAKVIEADQDKPPSVDAVPHLFAAAQVGDRELFKEVGSPMEESNKITETNDLE